MYKLKTVLFQFYRPIFAINLLFDLYLIHKNDIVSFVPSLAFKLIAYAFLIAYQYFTQSNTYYYFRNAGYSIRRLYAWSVLLDLLIYSTVCLFFYLLHELLHS